MDSFCTLGCNSELQTITSFTHHIHTLCDKSPIKVHHCKCPHTVGERTWSTSIGHYDFTRRATTRAGCSAPRNQKRFLLTFGDSSEPLLGCVARAAARAAFGIEEKPSSPDSMMPCLLRVAVQSEKTAQNLPLFQLCSTPVPYPSKPWFQDWRILMSYTLIPFSKH